MFHCNLTIQGSTTINLLLICLFGRQGGAVPHEVIRNGAVGDPTPSTDMPFNIAVVLKEHIATDSVIRQKFKDAGFIFGVEPDDDIPEAFFDQVGHCFKTDVDAQTFHNLTDDLARYCITFSPEVQPSQPIYFDPRSDQPHSAQKIVQGQTPSFTSRQTWYYETRSHEIHESNIPGAFGDERVRVFIVGIGGLRKEHEDRSQNMGEIIGSYYGYGDPSHDEASRAPYTAPHNGFGISGMVPKAQLNYVYNMGGVANSIAWIMKRTKPGDTVIIHFELQYYTPGKYKEEGVSFEFVPVTVFSTVRESIKKATSLTDRNIHFVIPTGNGGGNLADKAFNGIFQEETGGTYVGAIDPRNFDVTSFSNWPAHACADGLSVTTTDYGDLWGWNYLPPERWYTQAFNGTSSASPIYGASLAQLLSVCVAHGKNPSAIVARRWMMSSGRVLDNQSHKVVGKYPNIYNAVAMSMADVDIDGLVDFYNFIAFARNFGNNVSEYPEAQAFDFNRDGIVNFEDFTIFADLFTTSQEYRHPMLKKAMVVAAKMAVNHFTKKFKKQMV